MIWGLRQSVWFGIALAALLLFLWCLLAMLEAEVVHGGYIWGLVIFGLVAAAAGAIALVGLVQSGGVPRGRDALTDPSPSAVPRGAAGRGLSGGSYRPAGSGEVPRASAGRSVF